MQFVSNVFLGLLGGNPKDHINGKKINDEGMVIVETQDDDVACAQMTPSQIVHIPVLSCSSSSSASSSPSSSLATAAAEIRPVKAFTQNKDEHGFRCRVRRVTQRTVFDRTKYNSISESSMWTCTLVMKHIDAYDWKFVAGTPKPTDDVVLVISPHHHLVDDAWRRVRTYCAERNLFGIRAKLTDVEKMNCLPKITRKYGFLVVVANSRAVAKRVLAAERIRLGFVSEQAKIDADGLEFDGIPLSPSSLPIRQSAHVNATVSSAPQVRFGQTSPVAFQAAADKKRAERAAIIDIKREAEVAAVQNDINDAPNSQRTLTRKFCVPPSDRKTRRRSGLNSQDTLTQSQEETEVDGMEPSSGESYASSFPISASPSAL